MSERELRVRQREIHRMHVVRLTIEGRETVGRGAKLLGISARQMKRLRRKMKERGVAGLLHAKRGKAAWNKTASEKIKQVLGLARGRYQGLNDTHFTEKLKEKEKIGLSRPTVRRILRGAGIAAVRKRGVKRHYKRRERKAQEGALLFGTVVHTAGGCTPKTNCSWRQPLLLCRPRYGQCGADAQK